MLKKLLCLGLLCGCSVAFAEQCVESQGGWYCGAVRGPTTHATISQDSLYVKFEYPGYSEIRCVNNESIKYSNAAEDTLIASLLWWYGDIKGDLNIFFCPDESGNGCIKRNDAYQVHELRHQTQVEIDISSANPDWFGCTPNWQ